MKLSSHTFATGALVAVVTAGLLAVGPQAPTTPSATVAPAETAAAAKPARRPRAKTAAKRFDQPAEAAMFAARKRAGAIETRGPNAAPGSQATPQIPVRAYLAAAAHIRRMPQYSSATNEILPAGPQVLASTAPQALAAPGGALGTWQPLGPGNIGGRTRQLVFHPTNPDIMYAAAVAGGVWKTTDAGASWNPLTDLLIPNIAVNSLAMDPKNPQVLYAGTGEGFFNFDGVRGAGIFKTTDGGATWTQLASTATADFHYVNDIVVSPRNSSRMWAATRTGVWRSTNAGATWTRVINGVAANGCFDLVTQTDRAVGYIFAACGSFSADVASTGIFRAVENGSSLPWQHVLTRTQEPGLGRISLALAPSNQNIVYALAASVTAGNYQDGMLGVFRSDNSGAPGSFVARVRNTDPNKLNTLLLSNTVYGFLADCGFGGSNQFFNQGWYDNVIAVDPTNPDRVWAGGIDLFRSDDGGRNWGQASHWWFTPGVDREYAHADQHVIAFHPQYDGVANTKLYVANDGGFFRTDNPNAAVGTTLASVCGNPPANPVAWTELNNNYEVTQFYHGSAYPDGDTYFGGTQDNGTLRGRQTTGLSWTRLLGGDGGYTAVDPTNTNVLFGEFTGLSIQKSTNGGASFFDAVTGISGDQGFAFIAPFTMNAANAQQLWTGGWFIWRTTDQAGVWARASAITAGNGSVSSVAVSPVNPNMVVVGMSDGYIHYTNTALTNNGTTNWPFTRPRTVFVTSVAFDPVDANTVYATFSTFSGVAVYKSVNGGASWAPIVGTGATALPALPVHTIVVDPTNTQRLYVGTDAGVFTSIDGGLNWYKEVTGFANVVTESLGINPTGTKRLFAFTHGRSAWRVDLQP